MKCPSVLVQALGELAERHMESPRLCSLCREAPGVAPLVFLADTATAGRVSGCVFATCMMCWCQDDFEKHVSEMLRKGQRRREAGAWN